MFVIKNKNLNKYKLVIDYTVIYCFKSEKNINNR